MLGGFRWDSGPASFDSVGEAETYDFLASEHLQRAYSAAKSLDLKWSNQAMEWVAAVSDEGLQVAIEQCCHDGCLLDADRRALRMQRFPRATRVQCEDAIRGLPDDCGDTALMFICWWVRINRAHRTGSPDLDPARSLEFPAD